MVAKTEPVRKVGTVGECSNFSCIASDGNTVWGLKINKKDENNLQSVLFYSANINESISHYGIETNRLGHGNGMTCNSNYIVFGCKPGKYIYRVPRDFGGNFSHKFVDRVSTETSVGAISTYKAYHHLIRNQDAFSGKNKGYDRFTDITVLENDAKHAVSTTYGESFYTRTQTHDIAEQQDIFYDKQTKHLFAIYNKKDAAGHLVINVIEIYDLGSTPTVYMNGCKCYEMIDKIVIDKSSNPEYTKYEVESIGLDANRKMLMACNIEGNGVSDAIERITNITF